MTSQAFPWGQLPGQHSPFWLQSPLEIRQHFRGLVRKGERVLLHYGPEASVVSSVLAVEDNGALLLDTGPDERSNRRLLEQPAVVLTGFLDGVEMRCQIGPLKMGQHDQLPALACAAPTRLHRLQRREFHRVNIPAGYRTTCGLHATPGATPVNASLLDLSLGGLRLTDPMAPGLPLSQGSVVKDCEVDLGDFGRFVVDLEVRYRSTVVTRTGHQSHKVGCRYVKLPSGAEHTLQRFIMQVQRDQRALASD